MERTTRETLLRIYEETETIAVGGASTTDGKPGHDVPRYLQAQGYHHPGEPTGGEILGERSYPSLRDIDVKVDAVDVFRPPEEAEGMRRGDRDRRQDAVVPARYPHRRGGGSPGQPDSRWWRGGAWG
jgi:predicted CoA-binding protein